LWKGQPFGLLYRHRVPGVKPDARVLFKSPVREYYVDAIDRLDPQQISIATTDTGYVVELAIPLATLGLTPDAEKVYKADFGILVGDEAGNTITRTYWSNTNAVNADVPTEAMATPNAWGELRFKE